MKKLSTIMAAIIMGGLVAQAQTLVLSDSFDTGGTATGDLNHNLAIRQVGSAATKSFSVDTGTFAHTLTADGKLNMKGLAGDFNTVSMASIDPQIGTNSFSIKWKAQHDASASSWSMLTVLSDVNNHWNLSPITANLWHHNFIHIDYGDISNIGENNLRLDMTPDLVNAAISKTYDANDEHEFEIRANAESATNGTWGLYLDGIALGSGLSYIFEDSVKKVSWMAIEGTDCDWDDLEISTIPVLSKEFLFFDDFNASNYPNANWGYGTRQSNGLAVVPYATHPQFYSITNNKLHQYWNGAVGNLDFDFADDLEGENFEFSFKVACLETNNSWTSIYLHDDDTPDGRGDSRLGCLVWGSGRLSQPDIVFSLYAGTGATQIYGGAVTEAALEAALGLAPDTYDRAEEHAVAFVSHAGAGGTNAYDFVVDGTTIISGIEYAFNSSARKIGMIGIMDAADGLGAYYDDLGLRILSPVELVVAPTHGTAMPPAGTYVYGFGTHINCSVDAFVVEGGTNYLCTGWTGTGSVPSSGTSNDTGLITLVQDSSISWNWITNAYWLDIAVNGSGVVNVAEGWYGDGTSLPVVATASSNWLFTGWSGDLAGDYTTASTNLLMDSNKSITAIFSDDADDDGLTNAEEAALGTDPRNGDSDSDGIPDGWEHNKGLDPLVADAGDDPDSDTLTNLEEYGYGTHPKQPDSDSDGLRDDAEINTHGTDPLDSDSEDDGMPDGYEIAKLFDPNIDDAGDDADSDGLSNLGEYQQGTDPHDDDSDDDGMTDGWEVDNSLNPKLDDAANDPDTDYLNNLQEYQAGTDPQDDDSDDDGLIDGIEILMGLNPTNPDSDSDGMPDGWEQSYGLLPLVDDAAENKDGDEHSNLQEFITGMSPSDPDSIFTTSPAKADAGMVVMWSSFTNRAYTVQWTDSLTNSFQTLEPTVDYPQNSYTDTLHAADSEGFYKVEVQLK